MKNRIITGIFFVSLLLMTSSVFGAMVENSRQGLPAISITSQPGSTDETAEPHQGSGLCLRIFTADSLFSFSGGYNLYRYVNNNPLIYIDPFGLIWVFASWTQYLETNVDVNRDPTYEYLPRFEIMRVDYWQYIENWIPEPPCFEQKKPQLGRAPRFQSFTPIGIRPFLGSTNYYSDKVPEKALYFKTDPVSSFRELPAPPPHN